MSKTSNLEITNYTKSWARQQWTEDEFKDFMNALMKGVNQDLTDRLFYGTGEYDSLANRWIGKLEEICEIINRE